MAKQSTTSNVATVKAGARNIPLKRVIDDIFKDTKVSLDPKRVRAKLRVALRGEHDHMQSWVFTQREYVRVRSMFDPQYAAKQTNAAKREAKAQRDAQSATNEGVNA